MNNNSRYGIINQLFESIYFDNFRGIRETYVFDKHVLHRNWENRRHEPRHRVFFSSLEKGLVNNLYSSDVFGYGRNILRYVCTSGCMEDKNKIAHACDAVVFWGNARVYENFTSRSFGRLAFSFLYVFVFSLPQSRTCIVELHMRVARGMSRFLLFSNTFLFHTTYIDRSEFSYLFSLSTFFFDGLLTR